MIATAPLIEIYSSYQGEGPHVGEAMVFVRFQDCALTCRFCDTPDSFKRLSHFRLEIPPWSRLFMKIRNPILPETLSDILEGFPLKTVSLTGGEPLQHLAFLQEWLPQAREKFEILLETNGIHPHALEKIIEDIHIVSMDMKLPSVTGMKAYWKEHEEFLAIASRKEVYVKVVVSTPTDISELKTALEIVKRVAPDAPFILQPVTPASEVNETIPEDRLKQLYEISCEKLPDVRVIPQVHAMVGLL